MMTMIATTAGRSAGWGGDWVDPWFIAGVTGAGIGALLLTWFVVGALMRHGRYRVVDVLDESDQQAVHEALKAAERKTVGEILPVVVERSDPHPGADWLAALAFVLVGTALVGFWLPWNHPVVVVTVQCALGAIGFGLSRALPDFKRRFVFEDRASEVANEQAFQEFYRNGLHKTEEATGVLIFVSLFEHRVVILADEGIDQDVNANFWADTDDAVLAGIRAGSLSGGLVAGIHKAGECLAQYHPWREGDRNEVPDRLVLRRE